MKKLALTALAAAALALPAREARADTGSGSGCGGHQFTMCASWSLVLNGSTYTLTVNNLASLGGTTAANSVFTQFGLGNSTDIDPTLTIQAGSTAGWSFGNTNSNPFSGQGLINLVFNATSAQGINGGVPVGGSAVINFTSSQALDIEQFAVHGQGGPNNCSSKAVFNLVGANQNGTPLDPALAANCGGTTVPEPATMTLVGTGIAGILAARRRRRQQQA